MLIKCKLTEKTVVWNPGSRSDFPKGKSVLRVTAASCLRWDTAPVAWKRTQRSESWRFQGQEQNRLERLKVRPGFPQVALTRLFCPVISVSVDQTFYLPYLLSDYLSWVNPRIMASAYFWDQQKQCPWHEVTEWTLLCWGFISVLEFGTLWVGTRHGSRKGCSWWRGKEMQVRGEREN